MRPLSSPALDRMVSRQVGRWVHREEHQKLAGKSCCVALSRLPGSGAAELGQRVAEELGFGFFGVELVDQIARASHVQPRLVERLDERMRDAIERFVRDGVHAREYDESHYYEALIRVLGTFAERGMAVLLGRGAPFVLPPERTFRVLVVASEAFRVARLRAATGLNDEEARERLTVEDAQRIQFNRHYFGVDPNNPGRYDLVVNSESLGVPAAVQLVLQGFHLRFPEARSIPGIKPTSKASGQAATL